MLKLTPSANRQECTEYGSRLPSTSDQDVLNVIADGATWALELLYQRYHKLLYSLIYKMVSDQQIAEDLLQETFLSVWWRATTYSAQAGTVRNWLLAISRNHTIDYLRKLRQRSAFKVIPLQQIELDEFFATADAAEEAVLHEKQAQLRHALMQLPEKRRAVLELSYFQGWTQAEIAELCHMPLGSVKSCMRLGLLQLKRELEEGGLWSASV